MWRSVAGVTSTYLLVDMGASYAIGVVYLGATNLTAAGTWRVRISTADATGAAGDAHDSTSVNAGVDPDFGIALLVLGSPATGRYLRVDISDSSLPYLEVGILRAMTKFQPGKNYAMGAQTMFRDYSEVRKGSDGQDWTLRGTVQRGIALNLQAVTQSEWETHAEPMLRHSGISRDVLVCLDPAATNVGRVTYFGLLEEMPAYEQWAFGWQRAGYKLWHRV